MKVKIKIKNKLEAWKRTRVLNKKKLTEEKRNKMNEGNIGKK
jgi:hypothetical protein